MIDGREKCKPFIEVEFQSSYVIENRNKFCSVPFDAQIASLNNNGFQLGSLSMI